MKASRNKSFLVDVLVNEALKCGADSWQGLWMDETSIQELTKLVAMIYDLDEFVAPRLQFSFLSHTRGVKHKRVEFELTDTIGGTKANVYGVLSPIILSRIDLHIAMPTGDAVYEDVTCNSSFMLEVISKVGQVLTEAYH